jgi:hypothetical protein
VIAVEQLGVFRDEKEVVSFKAVRDLGSSGLSGKSLSALRRAAGLCSAFTDTMLRLIMGQEGCPCTEAKVFGGVQA